MSQMISYPQFADQDILLWNQIEEKIPEYVEKCKQIGISEKRLRDQIDKEFKMLASSEVVGLYYLLVKAFDAAYVDRGEFVAFGDSNGAVIPNILGLTGVEELRRLKGILSDNPIYYPELFYGLKDEPCDANPSSIRMMHEVFYDVLFEMNSIIKTSQNYNNLEGLALYNYELRKKMGIYLSELDGMIIGDYERRTSFKNKCIPDVDEMTMKVFSSGEYNGDYNILYNLLRDKEFTQSYASVPEEKVFSESFVAYAGRSPMGFMFNKEWYTPYYFIDVPFIDDDRRKLIKSIKPTSLNDLSYAAAKSSIIELEDEKKVYREQYLEESIKNNDPVEYKRIRKDCLTNQVFSRVHTDTLMINNWRIVYYQVHYDEIMSKKIFEEGVRL